jgi:hypothetical protein
MTKRTLRKLELHKESIRQLDPHEVKEAAGGVTLRCTNLCTLGSCGHICP